jgi:hypothetical protein
MALKITLIAGSGMIQLEKNAEAAIIKASSGLTYTLFNSTLQIHQTEAYGTAGAVMLASELSNDIQDSGGATLASDALVRAYLNPIIGVVKTV